MNKHEKRMKKKSRYKGQGRDEKDITFDGLQKTTYMKDDMEGKIVSKKKLILILILNIIKDFII